MPRESILLPLVPRHAPVDPRQRPDQRRIQRRPDAAAIDVPGSNSPGLADVRARGSSAWRRSVIACAATHSSSRPARWLCSGVVTPPRMPTAAAPATVVSPSQPSVGPSHARLQPLPVHCARAALRCSAPSANSDCSSPRLARIGQHARVVVEHPRRHRGVQHALALLRRLLQCASPTTAQQRIVPVVVEHRITPCSPTPTSSTRCLKQRASSLRNRFAAAGAAQRPRWNLLRPGKPCRASPAHIRSPPTAATAACRWSCPSAWHDDAVSHNAVRNGAVRAHFLQRVAQNLPHNLGIAEQKRQRMLQRIARRALKSHRRIVDTALRSGCARRR